jgi:glutamate dehydrogenase
LVEETGHTPEDIAYAFATVMAVYGLEQLYTGIDALDGVIDGQKQLALYRGVQNLLRQQTAAFLRHGRPAEGLEPEIARYRGGVEYLAMNMAEALSEEAQARLGEYEARLQEEGLPAELAKRIAALEPLSQAVDIVRVANATQAPIAVAAKTIFAVRDAFRLDELARESEALAAGDYFDRLAVNSCLASVASAQRALAKSVIGSDANGANFGEWRKSHAGAAGRVAKALGDTLDTHSLTLAKLTVGVEQLRALAGL